MTDTLTAPEFKAFPKLPRLNRDMVVTEKIDGTNAAVGVIPLDQMDFSELHEGFYAGISKATSGALVFAQSRKRLIAPGKGCDNFGFAAWVWENAEALAYLGPGYHYGEWYGQGIQRGYDLDHKRFALFAVDRYSDDQVAGIAAQVEGAPIEKVPVLDRFTFDSKRVNEVCYRLSAEGSSAVPGYMKPEGVVAFHTASRQSFKVTILDDQNPKSIAASA